MQLKYIIVGLAILLGILSQRSFAGDHGSIKRLVATSMPHYQMNYKICFGDNCTIGQKQLVRDHFGTLKSEEAQEPVLDFIWDAIADAKPYQLKSSKLDQKSMIEEKVWANDILQRHAPDIARRQNGLNAPAVQDDKPISAQELKQHELSVSISIPYDKETLPQIMNAVECLKIQVADYNHINSL